MLRRRELERHLDYTTLIDVRWLLRFAEGKVPPWTYRYGGSSMELEGVRVPAWQQLPPDAEVTLDKVGRQHLRLPFACPP